MERIHLRRASLPAGRSGLWTSNFASSSRVVSEEERETDAQDGASVATRTDAEFLIGESRPLIRSLLPDDCCHADSNQIADPATGNKLLNSPGFPIAFGLPARLPHRRESLPFNFPDRSRTECFLRQGRRESLPTDCSRIFYAGDVLPELNITSMAPLPWKKEKRASQPNCVQPATSVPPTLPDKSFGCADEKENIASTAHLKNVITFFNSLVVILSSLYFFFLFSFTKETSRLTLRRGSAPTALHPLNWLDSPRGKRNASVTHFGRHGSLRLAKCLDQSEPSLRRRGSLPYELGRKLSCHEPVGRIIPVSPECTKFDVGLRRGSAPSDLLRNTGASIASCWIQFRDRIKMKVCDVTCIVFAYRYIYVVVYVSLIVG